MAILRKRVLAARGGYCVGRGGQKIQSTFRDPGLVRSCSRNQWIDLSKSVSDLLVSIHSMVRIQSYEGITFFLLLKCEILVLVPHPLVGQNLQKTKTIKIWYHGLVWSCHGNLRIDLSKSVSDILVSIHSIIRNQSYEGITIFLWPKCEFQIFAPPLVGQNLQKSKTTNN